ncbi:MAG: DNA-processing protein DprA [Nitrospirota bacterium]
MTDIRYWIGLSLVPDVGPIMSKRLLAMMGEPENIFNAGIKDLLSVRGLNKEKAENIKNFRLWDGIEKHIKVINKKGIKVIGFNDPRYPAVLKEVADAPIVLYMKGDYIPDDRYGIAIVGSRKHTHYGEAVTQKISSELSASGFTIISGMARGIDTISHISALSAGGRTIAVLGSGLDVYYPAENKGLMEKIILSGCVISEFPPGTGPNRENFPRRNRLISGLSLGVLVVEATADSGSLITATYALEQNKEVFAVPGNITSRNSEGTNSLIKQGAGIVLDTNDIIEELAPVLKGFIKAKDKKTINLTEEESSLCNILSREPKHIDLLSRESGIPVQKMLNLLLSLELKGIARQSSGKKFYLS